MIYRTTSLLLPHFIDKQITGSYGEEAVVTRMRCDRCGGTIKRNDFYYLLDNAVYCMDCREYAYAHIIKDVRENYIYVL